AAPPASAPPPRPAGRKRGSWVRTPHPVPMMPTLAIVFDASRRDTRMNALDAQARTGDRSRPMTGDPASLFAGQIRLPAIVEAGVEGRLGAITSAGGAARLTLGCYELFGGDPHAPGAPRLIA